MVPFTLSVPFVPRAAMIRKTLYPPLGASANIASRARETAYYDSPFLIFGTDVFPITTVLNLILLRQRLGIKLASQVETPR